MTKTWDTKRKILDMLKERRMTLTELAHGLDLAPSTVSQHIKELVRIGAISQVYNPFILKWKYYEPNRAFNGMDIFGTQKLQDVPIFAVPKNPIFGKITEHE